MSCVIFSADTNKCRDLYANPYKPEIYAEAYMSNMAQVIDTWI